MSTGGVIDAAVSLADERAELCEVAGLRPVHLRPCVLGVDPGVSGAVMLLPVARALSALGREHSRPEECDIAYLDLPHIALEPSAAARRRGSRTRSRLDSHVLVPWIRERLSLISHVVIEEQLAVEEQSRTAIATTFRNYGALVMAFELLGLPVTEVAPAAWKARLLRGLPKGKGSAVKRASQLFPEVAADMRGPRGGLKDGRAEALLVALYGISKGFA